MCVTQNVFARLPLRTEKQARSSKIKKVCYNHSEVLRLFEMTARCAHNLLLFTQNVLSVQFYSLKDGQSPHEATLMFEVGKQVIRIIRELDYKPPPLDKQIEVSDKEAALIANSNFLSALNAYNKRKTAGAAAGRGRGRVRVMQVLAVPQSSIAVSTVPRLTAEGSQYLAIESKEPCLKPCHWLVSSCMGQEQALRFANERNSAEFVAVGGVALSLIEHSDGSYGVDSGLIGAVFCYLPLPILTGLPVHINGAFALASSRRSLATQTADDKDTTKSTWNEVCRLGG